MKHKTVLQMFCVVASTAIGQSAFAAAIWTSLSDGSEVNFNIYAAKEDVYLNGGPGKGAGTNAPGLPDGDYIFMVTDPSGRTLLSSDAAECRQVHVTDGVFSNVIPSACQHATGSAPVGTPVQLWPYADTPNNGGVYKAWLTPSAEYLCSDLAADCDLGIFGFVPSHSKTDNFKVGPEVPNEIDTRFHKDGEVIDGMAIEWSDTLGASNIKLSYWAPELYVFHEAHVEAPEAGKHQIVIENQPGCIVQGVSVAGDPTGVIGPQTVEVHFTQGMINNGKTVFIDVDCAAP
jgi:hypothetical protein